MDEASSTVVGDVAVIDGRAAFILSQLLARSMRRGLKVRQIIAEARLAPEDQAAVLRAEVALEEAGERWRVAQLPQRGNAATRGNDEAVASMSMSTTAVAQVLGLSSRRVRQLATAGALSAVRGPHGWQFNRREVISYGCQRPGADVTFPPLAALPNENAA
jgi:hypothetical protein